MLRLIGLSSGIVKAEFQIPEDVSKSKLQFWFEQSVGDDGHVWLFDRIDVLRACLKLESEIDKPSNWNGSVFDASHTLSLLVGANDAEEAAEIVEKKFFRFGGNEAHFPIDIAVGKFATTEEGGRLVLEQIDPRVKRNNPDQPVLVVRLSKELLRDPSNWSQANG